MQASVLGAECRIIKTLYGLKDHEWCKVPKRGALNEKERISIDGNHLKT